MASLSLSLTHSASMANNGRSRSYKVTETKRTTVSPPLPQQEHRLPLSNLDLLLPPVDVSVFFCFQRPPSAAVSTIAFPAIAARLKASLSMALLHYYPLAGEVVANSLGEPELLCNNRGVDFVEAAADAELREIEFYDADVSVEGKIVPMKKSGILCVQATELRCGGVVVGCTFDHRVADAYSANMFIVSWAEAAAGKPISVIPSFRRSLLAPRRRPTIVDDSIINRLYVVPPPPPNSTTSPDKIDGEDDANVNRIYYVEAKHIEEMQSAASSGGRRRSSKLEAFSAYIWRLVAKASTKKGGAGGGCSLGIVVDGRSRLLSMENYFGNVLSIPFGTLGAEEIGEMELGDVAAELRGFLEEGLTREHFKGLIDWVEERRPERALARIYCQEGGEVALVVSSGRRFPVAEVDFGFGRPALGSYHFPWGGTAGLVMPMPSPSSAGSAGGDWVVYVHLSRQMVRALEAAGGGGVFQLLTSDHIGLTSDATS